jgi:tetratricopeptide (TPR) repeat protein
MLSWAPSMQPGTLFADRFLVDAPAGKGGMSEVYRARDRTTDRWVALKLFLHSEERSGDRFAREVEILATLKHSAIVEHVAHGVEGGKPYLVMEWLEGEDLAARLARGPLSIDETIALASRIAGALGLAHERGIVHRDVKPSNVFLPEGRIEAATLLDFGIARVRGGPQFTRFGEALGTPAYMAPEQARGGGDIDARVDVFALGVLLFECLTGRPPFWADHPLAVMAKILLEDAPQIAERRADAPAPLSALIQGMLAKDPAARPADGKKVEEALAAFASTTQILPHEAPVVERTPFASKELQLLSVVFVGSVQAPEPAPAVDALQPTMLADSSGGELDRVLTEVLRYGGWAERLADGSLVVTLPGRGAALDQATTAARCALAVARTMPLSPMALVTGRADVSGGFPVGVVIDRGVALLAAEHARSVPDGEARGVAIDDVTAGLLDRRFEIAGQGGSLLLRSERHGVERVRTLLGRPQPFVGRERELRRLLTLYDTCTTDRAAQAVLVVAPPGVGKSRLANELVSTLEQRHPTPVLLIGRGEPDRRQVELGVFAAAVRQLFGILDQEGAEATRFRVRARVGRNLAKRERDRVAAFIAELLGVHFPAEAHPLLGPARSDRVQLGDQIRAACQDLLAAELAAGPVVVVLEDLHHADPASLSLVDAALRDFADAPLLVVGLARPEIDEVHPHLWPERPLVRFELTRLGHGAAMTLARHALGEDADPAILERLVAQSDGNAFYLEELVRAVAAGRGDRLPETVLAVIQARLDELDVSERRVLRACSIFGDSFTVGGVRTLLGPSQLDEVALTLERLVDAELLVAPGSSHTTSGELGLGFRSALVREAAYASLTPEDRALGHRLAASWLEGAGAERDAIVVAHHLERAGDERLAAAWFARSAEIALEGNDFAAAIARADRGAAAGATGPLLGRIRLLQSEARRHSGHNAEMLEEASVAVRLLPTRTPPWWSAVANVTLAALRLGKPELLGDYVSLVEPPYEDLPASATRLAHYLHFAGQGTVADALIGSAMQHIGAFNEDPAKWAWGYRACATRAIMRGDVGECAEQLGLAIRSFDVAGDVRELATARIDLAGALVMLGILADARVVLREALSSSERVGLPASVASAAFHLAFAEARLGAFDVARGLYERAFAMLAEQKNRRMDGLARIYFARSLLEERALDRALEEARVAREVGATTPQQPPHAAAVEARVLIELGRAQEALDVIAAAIEPVLRGLVLDEGESLVHLTYAEALMATGQGGAARAYLRTAHERLLVRAGRIRDAAWRRSFLENVPENAKTIELVRAWLTQP